jgi:aspartate aminotransferase-like enzyme
MLLTPGPTAVPEFVRTAMSDLTLHHRTPEFEAIFEEARGLLLELLDMPEAVILASSGTGAMEACVTNLTHSKALTINAGKFGERFGKICNAHSIDYTELKYDWDTPANPDDIEVAITKESEIDAVFVQACESAGGLRHPVEMIAKCVKNINSDISVIVDGITAVGVEPIDITNIDALIGGSQKAFMLPPGLSMIGLSKDAVNKIENKPRGYYFNLLSELKKQRANTTAYTAATTLIIGLGQVLEKMKQIGFEKFYNDTKKRAIATRFALQSIGLELYPHEPAIAMSAVKFDGANDLRKILKNKYEVNLAGGQEHLNNKIFRINHMGDIADYEASWVLNAIELALDDMGAREFDSTANKAFLEVLYK